MFFENHSEQTICVGHTLVGAPLEAMILKPGESLRINDILTGVEVVFVTTPGGLRMAIMEKGLVMPSWYNGRKIT